MTQSLAATTTIAIYVIVAIHVPQVWCFGLCYEDGKRRYIQGIM